MSDKQDRLQTVIYVSEKEVGNQKKKQIESDYEKETQKAKKYTVFYTEGLALFIKGKPGAAEFDSAKQWIGKRWNLNQDGSRQHLWSVAFRLKKEMILWITERRSKIHYGWWTDQKESILITTIPP